MTAAIAPIASNGPAAAKAAGPSATPASPLSSAMAKHRQELGTLATTLPFFAYTACFLLAPTVIVIVGAFQDRSGNFTLANFNKMFEANTIAAFGTSILVSLASSLIGAVVGALASYALVIGAKPNGLLRRMVSAISSVLAQFGGVMLAFAFIATIGINGIGTMLIKTLTGYTVNPNWLSSLPGLVTIYCYFQIPLMIIIFLPAVDSIRPQWREACESLGGNTFQCWTRVACPILAPRFISAFLLLFASAFSAYATAAALFSQRSILVPLMFQGAMRNELDPNQQGFAQVLAFAMIIVVVIVMLLSHAVEKKGRTLAMTETSATATKPPQLRAARVRKQSIIKFVILFVTLAFLFVPLLAMLIFTLRHPLSGRWSAAPWIAIFTGDGESLGADLTVLWQGIGTSLALSAVTVVIMLVLLVPIMVIVHIRSKALERAIEWVATLPLTIPAIVLVVGLGPIYRWLSADVLSTNPIWLCFAYVILVMPFAFRAIAVGLNSIDVKTLVEASRSLGASWPKVFFKVIIPNLWQSILSASFISIAVVLGEYTVASLLGRMSLQVALYQLGQSNSISTAMSLLALLFGVVLLVALDLISDAMRKSREGK
ncbi:aBC transporter permease component [Bifidobacterium longum CAG:69]|nr:aBC transporter permease component [Bifidobacterium longum CAG:69]